MYYWVIQIEGDGKKPLKAGPFYTETQAISYKDRSVHSGRAFVLPSKHRVWSVARGEVMTALTQEIGDMGVARDRFHFDKHKPIEETSPSRERKSSTVPRNPESGLRAVESRIAGARR